MNRDEFCARLDLHKSWRDSQGELNDAPNLAAAHIRAQDARIKRLEEALREIAETPNAGWIIARAALEATNDE